MPIGAADTRKFRDFANRTDSPVTQAHQLHAKIREREMQKSALEIDAGGKSNLTLIHRVRDLDSGEFFLWQAAFFYQKNDANKDDFKRQGPDVDIWRFWRKGAFVYYRANSIEVDLSNPMPPIMIFCVLCCDGALHLHLTDKKFYIRYLVDPQTLVR